MRSCRRSGLTLRDVVVVIVVLLVLFCLCLPATRTSREAYRRMECSNRLRQIGMALINYEIRYKQLPAGWTGPAQLVDRADQKIYIADADEKQKRPPIGRWSAFVSLLPFLDRTELDKQIQVEFKSKGRSISSPIAPWNSVGGLYQPWASDIDVFRCPSDSSFTRRVPSLDGLTAGRVNYAFCYGDTGKGVSDAHNDSANRGLFQGRYGRHVSEVLDGYAYTIMLAEIASTPSAELQRGRGKVRMQGGVVTGEPDLVSNPRQCRSVSLGEKIVEKYVERVEHWRGLRWMDGAISYTGFQTNIAPNLFSCSSGEAENDWGFFSASSYHGAGVYAVFADCNVRYIPNSIDTGDDRKSPPSSEDTLRRDLPSPYGAWGAMGTINSNDQWEPSSLE